jgi:hypothetical protein
VYTEKLISYVAHAHLHVADQQSVSNRGAREAKFWNQPTYYLYIEVSLGFWVTGMDMIFLCPFSSYLWI